MLARCLFKRILLILLIFVICKNRENIRNIITLKQESSQFKINLKCANNDTVFFFLEIFRKLLGYRVRTQAFVGTCTSYHYNSHTDISFSCDFLHGGICFLIFYYVHRNLEVFIFYFTLSFLYMQKQRRFNAITLC